MVYKLKIIAMITPPDDRPFAVTSPADTPITGAEWATHQATSSRSCFMCGATLEVDQLACEVCGEPCPLSVVNDLEEINGVVAFSAAMLACTNIAFCPVVLIHYATSTQFRVGLEPALAVPAILGIIWGPPLVVLARREKYSSQQWIWAMLYTLVFPWLLFLVMITL